MAPGIWGGASWPPSAYDPVQQRLFVCASSVINGFTGGGEATFVPPEERRRLPGRRDDVHARGAHGHHRGAGRHHQQARVALSVARAVLQRHAGHRGRAAVRRPHRRAADRARFGHRQAVVGVPDRRRDARAGEHVRAQRQAVRAGVLGRQPRCSGPRAATACGCSASTARCRPPSPARPVSRQTAAPPPPAEAVAAAAATAGAPARRVANLAAGQRLYEQACVVCHGADGKGGHGAAPSLAALTDLAAMMRTVTAGRNDMPPFGATFTPEQIRDVSTYVLERLTAQPAR